MGSIRALDVPALDNKRALEGGWSLEDSDCAGITVGVLSRVQLYHLLGRRPEQPEM